MAKRVKINSDLFAPTTPKKESPAPAPPPTPEPDSVLDALPEPVAAPEKSVSSQTSKTSSSQNSKVDKQQVTVYLPPRTVDEITIAQLKLKHLTGKRGHSLSNSAIVEAALQIALNDLKENGANSHIARYIGASTE